MDVPDYDPAYMLAFSPLEVVCYNSSTICEERTIESMHCASLNSEFGAEFGASGLAVYGTPLPETEAVRRYLAPESTVLC